MKRHVYELTKYDLTVQTESSLYMSNNVFDLVIKSKQEFKKDVIMSKINFKFGNTPYYYKIYNREKEMIYVYPA